MKTEANVIGGFNQWRNEPKNLGGAQSLRGSVATERGEGVGVGGRVWEGAFSFFDLKMCNLGHT